MGVEHDAFGERAGGVDSGNARLASHHDRDHAADSSAVEVTL